MDNTVIWVTIIGVIGTLGAGLGGVYLGNWLQSRNIKQQREWMLEDQKREWARKQKLDNFERILGYIEGTLKYISMAKWIINSGSPERKEELFREYMKQVASVGPVIHTIVSEDKQLADLVLEFSLALERTGDIIRSKNFDITDKEQRLSKVAGQIKQRINELLEKTFD